MVNHHAGTSRGQLIDIIIQPGNHAHDRLHRQQFTLGGFMRPLSHEVSFNGVRFANHRSAKGVIYSAETAKFAFDAYLN